MSIGSGMIEEMGSDAKEEASDVSVAIDQQTIAIRENTEAMMTMFKDSLVKSGVPDDKMHDILNTITKTLEELKAKSPPRRYFVKVNRNNEGFIDSMLLTPHGTEIE